MAQRFLTRTQAIICYKDAFWVLIEFDIYHWLVNLNCNKNKFVSLEKQLEN